MRVLITNLVLDGRTGTETFVQDLAFGLQSVGCQPIVYSPQLGATAKEIARQGIQVASRLADVSASPDIIHGHHNLALLEALARFPNVPALFVCHDPKAWHDYPPLIPGIHRYVAVDLNCRERLARELRLPAEKIRVILNSVDTTRFRPRPILPRVPRRALVFSSRLSRADLLGPVKEACSSLKITLETLGSGSRNETNRPELVLPGYDLVFAKARCALEALAVGCSVIVCDAAGLGPMVTSDQVDQLRAWNFGARLLTHPIEVRRLRSEIARYDPTDAAKVREHIREKASLGKMIEQYLDLYGEMRTEPGVEGPSVEELRACEHSIKQLRLSSPVPRNQFILHDLTRLVMRMMRQPGSYLRRIVVEGEVRRLASFLLRRQPRGTISGK